MTELHHLFRTDTVLSRKGSEKFGTVKKENKVLFTRMMLLLNTQAHFAALVVQDEFMDFVINYGGDEEIKLLKPLLISFSLHTFYPQKAGFWISFRFAHDLYSRMPSPLAHQDHRSPWEHRVLELGGIPTSCSFSFQPQP